MKLCTTVTAALLIVMGGLSSAQGQIVFSDDFDGGGTKPAYADQTEFESHWAPLGCAFGCSANQFQGLQLNEDFVGMGHEKTAFSQNTTVSDEAQRSGVGFTASPALTPGDKLAWSFDFFDRDINLGTGDDPAVTPSPFRHYANLQSIAAPTLTNQLISMGMNNNLTGSAEGGNYYMARILGFGTGSPYFKLNEGGAETLRSPGWHNLKVEISLNETNTNAQDYHFFVDDILSKTILGVGTVPRTYSVIRASSGVSNGDNYAYFDNFLLEFVPAPPPGGVDGDFNDDGKVDAADYVVWRKNNGGGTALPNDNGLGTPIGSAHYNLWVANFGDMEGGGGGLSSAAVPEPATVALLMLGLAAMVIGRRNR